MALSDITRKTLRSDLRARLAKVATEELLDSELNQWLNMGQFDVANRLSAISDMWYGTVQSYAGTISIHSVGTVEAYSISASLPASKIMKYSFISGSGASSSFNGKLIPWYRMEDLLGMADSTMYDDSWGVASFGESLYFFFGANVTMDTGAVNIHYIRKPDEMTSDSAMADVPTQFCDLVILFAQSKALGKLGMTQNKQEIDQDISERFNEIKSMYSNEMGLIQAEKAPGVQTPRNR